MNASSLRATLLLALVFATGIVIGVATDRLDLFGGGEVGADETVESAEADDRQPRGPEGERRERQTTIEAFADELGLTMEQREVIEGHLDHFREGAALLQREVRPRYRALMDSVRTEIEAVLTDEQREDYRGLLRQRYGGGREDEREDGREDGRRN